MKHLSEGEEDVMAALWQLPCPAPRSDLQKLLSRRHGWADSTVLNFLYRLEEKGFVKTEKQGNRNFYTPLVRRKDYAAGRAVRLVEQFCGGNLNELLDVLADAGHADLPTLERLRGHLDSLIADSPEYSEYYDTWER